MAEKKPPADRASPGGKQLNTRQGSQAKIKTQAGGDAGADADDYDAWMKSRQLLKPDDQLDLTEGELAEEISKVLTTTNMNVLRNLVVYNFKTSEFIPLPPASDTVTLASYEGTALHVDSDEAKLQMEVTGEIGYPLPMPTTASLDIGYLKKDFGGEDEGERNTDLERALRDIDQDGEENDDEEGPKGDGEADGEGEADEAVEAEGEEGEQGDQGQDDQQGGAVEEGSSKRRKLINQFNYCERAALTFNFPRRSVDTQTIPPPRSQFGATVLQWVIYDSYAQDFEEQMKDRDRRDDRKSIMPHHQQSRDTAHKKKTLTAEILNQRYLRSWQILERMINQNIYDDIANDYRYWEDPSDEFREGEGTVLPLWKFQFERTKKMSVTDVSFNPHYYDLFAVCYGSHDFMKQPTEGAVCLFTIKNPSYPDYIIITECGVMCCDIHPKYPFLVAIGMYDGNVAVYNLKENYQQPLYISVGADQKHTECVWEIKWGPDMADGEINFYSVSAAGRVYSWVLMQNDLALTVIITLYLADGIVEGPDGTAVRLISCGSCMKFHPTDPEIFLIGTEEGLIYKCSIAFSSKYLMTYYAHYLSVYRIDFNRFNSNIFVSCSGDWRIKVWEDMREEPLFIFDLGSGVGDVQWAPYSSTVFAAVTTDGKVFVFDLNVNKYKAICVQAVVPKRRNKLTRLAFNEKLPFIVVGDDKGTMTSLKLSPNLRLMVKPPKKQLYLDQNTLQIQKLEKLLSLVRELPEGEVIKDTTTTVKS